MEIRFPWLAFRFLVESLIVNYQLSIVNSQNYAGFPRARARVPIIYKASNRNYKKFYL